MSDIKFKIGQEHENRKGVYKVMATNKDAICIRWESGEEVTTTAALQSRIIECMHQELAFTKTKKGGKCRQPETSKSAIKFEGIKKDDFSKDVAGATWRYYDSLGGAVAVRLKSDKFDIASWPSYGFSTVYWADPNHRRHDSYQPQAKFFARLDENCLYFGLDIDRSNQEKDAKDNWNAFITWLRDPENDSWLKKVVSDHDFSIYDVKDEGFFAGIITSAGGKWRLFNEGREEEIASLANFLDDLADGSWLDLQMAKTVKKGKAVTRGAEIADDIAELFEMLMPVYEAAAVSSRVKPN